MIFGDVPSNNGSHDLEIYLHQRLQACCDRGYINKIIVFLFYENLNFKIDVTSFFFKQFFFFIMINDFLVYPVSYVF